MQVIADANKESSKYIQELDSVQTEVAKLKDHMKNLKETNWRLEKELEDAKEEHQKFQKETSEERTKMKEELKAASGDEAKVRAAEVHAELYKSLLDTALNKLRLLEDHFSVGSDDVKTQTSCSPRGRFVLRVNTEDPTDMFVEETPHFFVPQNNANVINGNLDAESLSSEDFSSSKRTSLCSSVTMSELLGSETHLPSVSSLGSSMRGEEDVFNGVDVRDLESGHTIDASTFPTRKRASSEGGQNFEASLKTLDIRSRTATIDSPTYRCPSTASLSGSKSSVGQLVQSSTESLTELKPSVLSSRVSGPVGSTESVERSSSRHGSTETEATSATRLNNPEETPGKPMKSTTVRELKRKKSDSYKYKSLFADSPLQRHYKYRSVGDLIKGITGERRRSSREENPADIKVTEDKNGDENKEEVPPLLRSKTLDADTMPAKILKTLQRKTTGNELQPNLTLSERRANLTRQASDESTSSSRDVTVGSSPNDDSAGTRTSGFGALRSRRNGLVTNQADFKDISKLLRKKQQKGGRDFPHIFKRFSRDTSEDKDDSQNKSLKKRSKNK